MLCEALHRILVLLHNIPPLLQGHHDDLCAALPLGDPLLEVAEAAVAVLLFSSYSLMSSAGRLRP